MLKDFLALSRILTGVESLDETLGRAYLDRLRSTPFDPYLRRMIVHFRTLKRGPTLITQVKKELLADATFRSAICQIILLWYTSTMQESPNPPNALRYGMQEEYFSGLVWSTIGGHVPGVSGGYFGHWRYRPENEPP